MSAAPTGIDLVVSKFHEEPYNLIKLLDDHLGHATSPKELVDFLCDNKEKLDKGKVREFVGYLDNPGAHFGNPEMMGMTNDFRKAFYPYYAKRMIENSKNFLEAYREASQYGVGNQDLAEAYLAKESDIPLPSISKERLAGLTQNIKHTSAILAKGEEISHKEFVRQIHIVTDKYPPEFLEAIYLGLKVCPLEERAKIMALDSGKPQRKMLEAGESVLESRAAVAALMKRDDVPAKDKEKMQKKYDQSREMILSGDYKASQIETMAKDLLPYRDTLQRFKAKDQALSLVAQEVDGFVLVSAQGSTRSRGGMDMSADPVYDFDTDSESGSRKGSISDGVIKQAKAAAVDAGKSSGKKEFKENKKAWEQKKERKMQAIRAKAAK